MECRVCKKPEHYPGEDATATGVCDDCRTKLGVRPMPPSRRRHKPCAHCNEMEFVRVIPRELTATGSDYVYSQAAPMTATIVPTVSPRLIFRGNTVGDADVHHGVGHLEMYICTTCGFIEWHCQNPEQIPIGPEYMTEVIGHTPRTPHRD